MVERVVPAHPSLEQYRKQAKDLYKEVTNRAPAALDRMRRHHPRLRGLSNLDIEPAILKLADAQLTIAREHGFESWPKFSDHIRTVANENLLDSFSARVAVDVLELNVEVTGANGKAGIVMFVLAGDIGRQHRGIRQIAAMLNRASFCTVLTDLLTDDEEIQDAIHEDLRFDVRMLAKRVAAVTDWLCEQTRIDAMRGVGYFASGTGAAAAVIAAAEHPGLIRAVVSGAGRPDLAGPWLWRVQAPTLFISGSDDVVGFGFTRSVMNTFPREIPHRLVTISGAGRRFDEGGAAEEAGALARDWFSQYISKMPV